MGRNMRTEKVLALALVATVALATTVAAPPQVTDEAPMMRGDTDATRNGWSVKPVFTVGESLGGYRPPGILDGLGVFEKNGGFRRILVTHELDPEDSYVYELANGTELVGARISYLDIQKTTLKIHHAGVAFDTVYDRAGNVVTDPAQINQTGSVIDGFARFCSARAVEAGEYGFVDDIFFAGEEISRPAHPHGGTEWALDVDDETIWAVPAMGRAAWENVAPLETGDDSTIALLGGDDVLGAPLYLYVGQKDALGDGSFLDRNGLAVGALHVWVADDGDLSPLTFNGLGAARSGSFVEIDVRDPAMAGSPGYDDAGYLDDVRLRFAADVMGAFSFSRPEDVHGNPANGTQAVFASTGFGSVYPTDRWGTIYRVDVDFTDLTSDLTILHDADDLPVPDTGIRSPDNLTWADDGFVYVQEDRSTSQFGAVTGIEASIWQLDPSSGAAVRMVEMDRSAVAPADATDNDPFDLGDWESSGVIDVTDRFKTRPDETLLLVTVQAHSVRDGSIGGATDLVQGGQLVFLSNEPRRRPGIVREEPHATRSRDAVDAPGSRELRTLQPR